MTIPICWARLSAAYKSASFASLLLDDRGNRQRAHKAQLNEWENEGGNLAPPRAPADAGVTAVLS